MRRLRIMGICDKSIARKPSCLTSCLARFTATSRVFSRTGNIRLFKMQSRFTCRFTFRSDKLWFRSDCSCGVIMVNAANLDVPPDRVMWDAPPSSEAVDFANTLASVAARQNSGLPIRLAQAATPVAPGSAGPFPIVPGIMPGSFENAEWTKNAVNGLVGLSHWMEGLFHSSPPAWSDDLSKSGHALSQAQARAVDPARAQQLAKARQQWSTAQKITPPGFCHDEEYNRLNAAVDRACNSAQACSPLDSPQMLHAKAFAFKQCALARSEREDQCFKGGDGGHREQIRNFWRGHDTCQTLLGLTP
jgi:hypothetical protein